MASPSARLPWQKGRRIMTGGRMRETGKPAGRPRKRCIDRGGDRRKMKITLETRAFAEIETDAIVSYAFEEADPVQGRIAELDAKCGGLLRKLGQTGELTGKSLEMTLVHAPAGLKAQRLLVVGAGKSAQYGTPHLRKLAGAALRFLKARSVKRFAFVARESDTSAEAAQSAAE